MVVGGIISKWTPPRKAGEIPRVNTRFSLSVENEQADAKRNGRIGLARPTLRRDLGRKKYVPRSADHERTEKKAILPCWPIPCISVR